MQFRGKTVGQISQQIGRLGWRGSYITGNVLNTPAPTSTTFALTQAKPYPDDHFVGKMFHVISGTGAEQLAFCSASAAGTGIITVSPALDTPLDTTSLVECWPDQISPDDVISNINLALEDVQDRINVYLETSNPTIDAECRVITIPSNYVKFCDVRYKDSGGLWKVYRYSHSQDQPGQEQGRDFFIQGRSVYLSCPVPSDIANTTNLVISGYRLPNLVTSYSDQVECPSGYVVYKATALLDLALVGLADTDPEGHSQRASGWLSMSQQLRDLIPYTSYRPTTIVLDADGS